MPVVLYREVNKSDVPALAKLRSGEWGTENYWQTRISGYLDCKLHPQQALLSRIMYIALKDETAIGLIAGHLSHRFECDGELQWLNVVPEYQRMGIASGLLRLLANWFIERKSFRICVDVDPDNTIAQNFYLGQGAEMLNTHWWVWNDIRIVLKDS